MKPTRPSILVALALVSGAVLYAVTSRFYGALPALPLYGPVFLILLAAAEGYTASTTAARLAGRPRTEPIHPLTVARIAALAKATSPVAAIFAGGYAGFLAYAVQVEGPHAAADVRACAVGLAASLALVGAALAMERVCRVKPPKPGTPEPPAE